MRLRIVLWVVVLVGIGALGFAIFASLERETRTDEVGYRGEARSNPLLGAERLLEALGVPAASAPVLADLPPEEHLLIVRLTAVPLGERRTRELVEWAERGGHLVVALAPEIEGEALRSHDRHGDLRHLGLGATVVDAHEGSTGDFELSDGEGGSLALSIDVDRRLADLPGRARFRAGARMNAALLAYEVGEGRVTVAASSGWLENDGIGEEDHAEILWHVARWGGEPAGAMLVHSNRMPGLFAALARHASPALAGLGLLLALWLWRGASRFGPILPAVATGRREFAEHVRATGRFLWRFGRAEPLLESLRAAALRRVELARPELSTADPLALAQALAPEAGIPSMRLANALTLRTTDDRAEFQRVVADLERLRTSL